MKIPRSFSLLTLLLLTSVVALAIVVYSTRTELSQLKTLNEKLSQQTGFIEINDPTQLHIRKLRYNVPMTFNFQVYAPRGQSYALKIGEGIVNKESGYPPLVIAGKIEGGEDQGTVILNLRRIGTGWILRDFGEFNDMGGAFCDDSERFHWLEQNLETSFSMIGQNHGSTETFDASSSVTLWQRSENDGSGIGPIPKVDVENPRVFMIWLEPIGEIVE